MPWRTTTAKRAPTEASGKRLAMTPYEPATMAWESQQKTTSEHRRLWALTRTLIMRKRWLRPQGTPRCLHVSHLHARSRITTAETHLLIYQSWSLHWVTIRRASIGISGGREYGVNMTRARTPRRGRSSLDLGHDDCHDDHVLCNDVHSPSRKVTTMRKRANAGT
jgi:hypothetical protein